MKHLYNKTILSDRPCLAFTLPTVFIIGSMVLLILITAVQSVFTVNIAITNKTYASLAKEAAGSGLTYARNCLENNYSDTTSLWTDTKPLGPNTDCSGNTITNCYSLNSTNCNLQTNQNTKLSFQVKGIETTDTGQAIITSTGIAERVNTTTSQTIRAYQQTAKLAVAGLASTATSTGGGWGTVSATKDHACAVASDDWVYCWGANNLYQLGNGTTTGSASPVAVSRGSIPAGATIKAVMVGWFESGSLYREYSFSYAIASDNQVYYWGTPQTYGSYGPSSTPARATGSGAMSGLTIKPSSAQIPSPEYKYYYY